MNIYHVTNSRGALCLSQGRRMGYPAWGVYPGQSTSTSFYWKSDVRHCTSATQRTPLSYRLTCHCALSVGLHSHVTICNAVIRWQYINTHKTPNATPHDYEVRSSDKHNDEDTVYPTGMVNNAFVIQEESVRIDATVTKASPNLWRHDSTTVYI